MQQKNDRSQFLDLSFLLLPFRRCLLPSAFFLLTFFSTFAADLNRTTWKVDGVEREALIYAPPQAKTNATPVVFAFHGHGGTMNQSAHGFNYHTLWPEALVVYPQGLKTPGHLHDPEGKKNGWQHNIGSQDDRDLKFFDAMLASLKKDYRVDEKRIYSTGFSNGGGFTFLLWLARGDQFAALAPGGAAVATNTPEAALIEKLQPKPVLLIDGEKDPLIKLEWQKQTIAALCQHNHCDDGQPQGEYCTLYPSKISAPVMTYIHPGGHQFPHEAAALVVKFFKEHALP